MYKKILVAYDESIEAGAALTEALDLASSSDIEFYVVTVVEPLSSFYQLAAMVAPEVPEQLLELRRQQLSNRQEQAVSMAAAKGINAKAILRNGEEVEQLVTAARELQPDLLVLGLHKHDVLARWVGTAHLIAQTVNCSVLAVSQHRR